MHYDFTSIMDRAGRDALAVDGVNLDVIKEGFDVIPMWVADMNFPTVPSVIDAIVERAKHPAFGYFSSPQPYYDAIIGWQAKRNGVSGLERKHIGYANGVIGGVAAALKVLCSPGEHVLIHAPTYIGFTKSLEQNGFNIALSSLVLDDQGVWRMDFEDMEAKILQHKIHTAILCSPHNPCGRVWERWELEKAMELFRKHDVFVISDEIWSDLVLADHHHIPTQSISEDAKMRTVALYAPSKTFNLAGLVGSYSIVYNDWLRDRMNKEISRTFLNGQNVLSMHALMAAYQPEGEAWLEQLQQVLTGNVDFACDYIKKHFEGVSVCKPQGTYMLFVDCTEWCATHGKSIEDVKNACWEVGCIVQDGRPFHGPCHLRINLASPLSRIQEAFRRMDQYVFNA